MSDYNKPTPPASQESAGEADGEEDYQLGKRDGYEEAVQDIDVLTGGDGEYCYCTDGDPDRHTPDASSMRQRIADRYATLTAELAEAREQRDARVSGENHKAAIAALEDTLREVCADNAKLREERDKYYQQVINVGGVAINSVPQDYYDSLRDEYEEVKRGLQCPGVVRQNMMRGIIANPYADEAKRNDELSAANDRLRDECEMLRVAVVRLLKSFPTDSDMAAAGWESPEINEACDAYDAAQAALSASGREGAAPAIASSAAVGGDEGEDETGVLMDILGCTQARVDAMRAFISRASHLSGCTLTPCTCGKDALSPSPFSAAPAIAKQGEVQDGR